MNILFNSSGIPLLMQSTYIFGETTGTPQNEMKERTRILAPYDLSNVSYIDIDGVKVRPWGDENDFPQKAAEEIGNTSVLNTGLKFLRNLTLGQGIYPCTVKGYDNDGNEILKPVTDSRVQAFIASRNVRRDSWSNDDLYGMPIWWPAYVCGWVEIAHLIPHFLKKAYKNQITWKWHVQIPYSYWEKKYPSKDYSAKEREAAIQKYMDSVEQNLCGPDNAEKPIFSHYAVNEMNGRIEEEWKIKPLENKYQGSDNLPVSAAANSEILFALMVNPNVLGAGMPGGTYAGNQGGSNIREAFLVNIANAWIDRQNILDPIELYIKMNGMPECELRFRNTVLVTLDTGSGTKKTLS